jgi:hypothetical protein
MYHTPKKRNWTPRASYNKLNLIVLNFIIYYIYIIKLSNYTNNTIAHHSANRQDVRVGLAGPIVSLQSEGRGERAQAYDLTTYIPGVGARRPEFRFAREKPGSLLAGGTSSMPFFPISSGAGPARES